MAQKDKPGAPRGYTAQALNKAAEALERTDRLLKFADGVQVRQDLLSDRITALQDEVAALGNGSTHTPSPSAPSAAPSFQTWFPNALVAYISTAGKGAVGTNQIPDTIAAISGAWMTVLVASGASEAELSAFEAEVEQMRALAVKWANAKTGAVYDYIAQKREREGNTDITAPDANPAEVDPNIQKAVEAAMRSILGGGMPPSTPQPVVSQEEAATQAMLAQMRESRGLK